MSEAGSAVDESLLVLGAFDPDISKAAAQDLLTRPSPSTAVFAANDLSAMAVIEAANRPGWRLPDDLSVVGFDNIPESAMTRPTRP